jgi:8-oxo-dGTP diphosphatase
MGAFEQGADATDGRWLTLSRTLSFVYHGDDVLMLKRAAHKRVFPNRYNGLGGHVERGEDIAASARREILEETGLTVYALRLRAVSVIDAGAATGITLFVFTAVSESRETRPCDEGVLEWVPRSRVLGIDLVEDLPIVLPRLFVMPPDAPPLFLRVDYDADDRIRIHIDGALATI